MIEIIQQRLETYKAAIFVVAKLPNIRTTAPS